MSARDGAAAARPATAGRVLLDEPAPGVARLRLSNPARRGALDPPMLVDLDRALRGPAAAARCVVITGEGGVFSAGYDLSEVGARVPYAEAGELVAPEAVPAFAAVESHPAPVLAALNGPAIGGGLELALACDARWAARSARLGAPAGRLGLAYSHPGLRRFLDVLGPSLASEVLLLGRDLGAERAARLGLVAEVVDDDRLEPAVLDAARAAVAQSPVSLRANKRALRALRDAEATLPAEQARRLSDLRRTALASPDFAEGVRAFREKRAPRWGG